MTKYLAILRGINVGGRRKILMADLKKLFEDLGFSEVSTYIQSGNVFFSSPKTDLLKLAGKIEQGIEDHYGFDVQVIVLSIDELGEAVEQNPFLKNPEADINKLHLTFLKEEPSAENRQALEKLEFPPDEFRIMGKRVYISCAGRYSDTKITNNMLEKKLKVPATTRNWKTTSKLWELSQ